MCCMHQIAVRCADGERDEQRCDTVDGGAMQGEKVSGSANVGDMTKVWSRGAKGRIKK